MSGHSKWATIKHKKAATDAKKGKEFTRAAAMIIIAAKQGGGDPKMNFTLRLAIDKAKSVNMPAANIDRAIKRGTGELGGAAPEELLYEGYGPAGTAILIEVMTDNRNRTGPEIRTAFSKAGGNMAETGAVAYLFEHKGEILVARNGQKQAGEELAMAIIDSGAEDFEESDDGFVIYTKTTDLQKVKNSLESAGVTIEDDQLIYKPKTDIAINDPEAARKVLRLIDALEDNEDVTNVYSNYDISDEILEEL
jgi:YebC/PmpR family DNA-binding regulatory protein